MFLDELLAALAGNAVAPRHRAIHANMAVAREMAAHTIYGVDGRNW